MPTHNENGSTTFYIRGPHHLYLGAALVVTGWLCAPYYQDTAKVCYLLGVVIGLDDFVEHTINENTPLRLLFNWLRKKGWSYLR